MHKLSSIQLPMYVLLFYRYSFTKPIIYVEIYRFSLLSIMLSTSKNHPITPPTTKTAAVNITYLPNNPITKPIFPPLHSFISSYANNKTPVPRQAFYSYRRLAGTTPFILLSSLPRFTHSQSPVP